MSHIHSPGHVSGSAPASNAEQGHGASKSDHAMYSAMLALLSGIGENESISGSIATISETLYETMVQNGTAKIQNLENELEDSNLIEENWSAFQNYANWQQQMGQWTAKYNQLEAQLDKDYQALQLDPGNEDLQYAVDQDFYAIGQLEQNKPVQPPFPPGTDASNIQNYINIVNQYGTVDNYRSEQSAIAQEINVANTNVQNNKAIPDAMQAEVEQLTDAQGEFNAEIASFISLSRDQMMAIGG